jgi:PAS domain S-box-containing protein
LGRKYYQILWLPAPLLIGTAVIAMAKSTQDGLPRMAQVPAGGSLRGLIHNAVVSHCGILFFFYVFAVLAILATTASRESRDRFAKIFRASPVGMSISTREEGRYVDVNDALLQTLKYKRHEIVGRSALDLNIWVDPEDRVQMLRLADSGVPKILRTRFRTSVGEIREVNLSIELIQLDGVFCVLAITQDVTDAIRLENQFLQAQKMQALGRLAGGLAHDFNNLLTVIIGYTELSLQHLPPKDPPTSNLTQIKKAAERAASLIRQLLGFSRQQIVFPRILDVNAVIENLNEMSRRLIGEDISLVFRPGAGLGRIKADPGQIEQVLMNLLVNARDAMPRGGKLLIETSNIVLEDPYLDDHLSIPRGSYVILAVSDTGSGMDAATMAMIFEPFFTTKATGQGSGLGLSTVYGIVKQCEGYIWVYSEPGIGTTFKLYFPRREEKAQPLPTSPAEEEPPAGRGTILLVEDDPALRKLMVTLLEEHGYTVLPSQSASDAVNLAQEIKSEVDLLLSDVVLPDLSGVELSALLRSQLPNLRVLLTSGYAGDLIARDRSIDPRVTLIEKPFTRRSLLSAIDRVLGADTVDGLLPG